MNKIKEKLEAIDPNVSYGLSDSLEGDAWNYIVFGRTRTRRKESRNGYSDYYMVAIIRENYIPEGLDQQVIEAMESIDGMRLATDDCNYDYTRKDNTNTVIEVLTMQFVRARK